MQCPACYSLCVGLDQLSNLSVFLSLAVCASLSQTDSFRLLLLFSLCLSSSLSLCPYLSLSVSVCLSLSVCMSVCLSLSSLPLCLSIFLSVTMQRASEQRAPVLFAHFKSSSCVSKLDGSFVSFSVGCRIQSVPEGHSGGP